MPRKKDSVTFSLKPGDIERLDDLAIAFGCLWGDRANPSELMRQIAAGEILLYRPGAQVPQDKKGLKLLKTALAGAKAVVSHLEKILRELER